MRLALDLHFDAASGLHKDLCSRFRSIYSHHRTNTHARYTEMHSYNTLLSSFIVLVHIFKTNDSVFTRSYSRILVFCSTSRTASFFFSPVVFFSLQSLFRLRNICTRSIRRVFCLYRGRKTISPWLYSRCRLKKDTQTDREQPFFIHGYRDVPVVSE